MSDFLVLRAKVESLCFKKELVRELVLDFCH